MPDDDGLARRMADFEIHALRGLATALVVFAQAHARRHPDPACKALAERLVYLKDEHYRDLLEEMRAQVALDVAEPGATRLEKRQAPCSTTPFG